MQTATLACIVANANRDPEQQPEPFTLEDFLPVEQAEDVSMETGTETPLDVDEAPAEEARPAWMAWKEVMQIYADATAKEKE